MNYEHFNELVKNKSVALVGPSFYLDDIDQSRTIDSYDLVVRINWGWPVMNPKLGSKTDILGHCCHPYLNVRDLPLEQIKYLIFLDVNENEKLNFDRNPNQYLLIQKANNANVPFHTYGSNCEIYNTIKFNGVAGVSQYIVQLLLFCQTKEIYLTGFSPTSGYHSGYPLDHQKASDEIFKNCFEWFVSQSDKRINFDNVMKKKSFKWL